MGPTPGRLPRSEIGPEAFQTGPWLGEVGWAREDEATARGGSTLTGEAAIGSEPGSKLE